MLISSGLEHTGGWIVAPCLLPICLLVQVNQPPMIVSLSVKWKNVSNLHKAFWDLVVKSVVEVLGIMKGVQDFHLKLKTKRS